MASYVTYPPCDCGCEVRVQTDHQKTDADGKPVFDKRGQPVLLPKVEITYCGAHRTRYPTKKTP